MNDKMSEEKHKKYQRMMKVVRELQELEEKIARLQFFILWTEECKIKDEAMLAEQLEMMRKLSKILQGRIQKGVY